MIAMQLAEHMTVEEKRTPREGLPYFYISVGSDFSFHGRTGGTTPLKHFKEEFSRLLQESDKRTPLLIDLSQVNIMYSSSFDALMIVLRTAKREGRAEELASSHLFVSILKNSLNSAFFQITSLSTILSIFEWEDGFCKAYEEEHQEGLCRNTGFE